MFKTNLKQPTVLVPQYTSLLILSREGCDAGLFCWSFCRGKVIFSLLFCVPKNCKTTQRKKMLVKGVKVCLFSADFVHRRLWYRRVTDGLFCWTFCRGKVGDYFYFSTRQEIARRRSGKKLLVKVCQSRYVCSLLILCAELLALDDETPDKPPPATWPNSRNKTELNLISR